MSSSSFFAPERRGTKKRGFVLGVAAGAVLILTLSHLRVLVAFRGLTIDRFHTQRALRDEFTSGRSSRQRRPSPLLQLGRLRNPSQKDETDGEVNASEERERNQATALQQSNEEVAGEVFVVEATQLAKEVDANMKEKWQPMYPEEGNVAIAGSQPLGSNVTFRINHEQHAGAHGLSQEDLAKITPKTNLPNEREEFVRSTRSDPDGLKQQLAMHWNTVQCDYDEALAPPKIQLQHPLIEVAREGNRTTHTGILIDAARHFFPLPWLYELIDFIAVLGFDLIHFRLTDDQSFVVQLDCHPQLATSAHFNRTSEVYTAQELRQLVRFAKDRGVSIMPELNIPGHAGAWSGIPGMLYPCTNFICDRSYSIPLRIDQPMVLQVIEDVLKEILDIFDTSPYLHLGGDEVFMSDPCFTELQIWPNFQKFEDALREMLGRLNVNPKNVVRWETTGKDDLSTFPSIARVKGKHLKRAGEVTHWWHNVPIKEEDLKQPFFMSTNLYFDMSKDKDAWDIATIAAARYALNPTAVIAATFELGPCSFQVRNVLGKLIAVAMASRKDMSKTREAFLADYRTLCLKMGLADDFCVLEGRPPLPTYLWKPTHSVLQKAWSATICERMTYPAMSFRIRRKDTVTHVHRSTDIEIAHTRATELRKEIAKTEEVRRFSIAKDPIYQFATNHTGVMVDLAHQFFTIEELRHIIDFVSKLGFNLLHVRLVENESFPIQMLEYGHLSLQQKRYTGYYTEDALRQLVEYAAFRGVRLMPEINFLSNAGGWLQSGSLVNCPNYICDVGGPIPMDVNHGGALLTVSVVCGLILQIFSTSPFLHLGSVDPVQAEPCYREAYPLGDIDVRKTFHVFEETILSVFQSMGVEKSRIVTRESSFDQLLGGVVHFTQKTPDDGSVTSPFLLSTGVSIESMEDDNAWQIYRQTLLSRKSGAMGVIVDTKGMDSKEWESQNVLGRLIAVAAALSDREEMDEVVFGSHYATICGKLGIPPAKCSSFGKPVSNATDWAKTRDSEATERKKAQCKRFTSKGVTRLPKESIFVINPRI